MPYCIHCGVKLDHRYTNCPLCLIPVEYYSKREEMPPLYPNDINKISIIKSQTNTKDWITIHFLGFITFLGILLTTGLDFYMDSKITWSLIPTLSAIFVYTSVSTILHLKKNPVLLYTLLNITLCLFLFIMDMLTSTNSWFLEYALPCFISLQLISLTITIIFRHITSILLRTVAITLGLNILLILINQIISGSISWAIILTSIFIPCSLYLIFIYFKFNSK